jgi:hypothetical protein
MTPRFQEASTGAASCTISTALTTRASFNSFKIFNANARPAAGHPAARGSPDKPAPFLANQQPASGLGTRQGAYDKTPGTHRPVVALAEPIRTRSKTVFEMGPVVDVLRLGLSPAHGLPAKTLVPSRSRSVTLSQPRIFTSKSTAGFGRAQRFCPLGRLCCYPEFAACSTSTPFSRYWIG